MSHDRSLLVWMLIYCALFFTALFGLIFFVQWLYPMSYIRKRLEWVVFYVVLLTILLWIVWQFMGPAA